jgi:RNA 2',3'-cyclic 3'-phosphodiesterase
MIEDLGRFFIAVPIPDNLKVKLQEVQKELQGFSSGFRWVNPNLMHITLLFLGEQTQKGIEDLSREIRTPLSETGIFSTSLGGLGAFPNPVKPRVLWIGVTSETARFIRLHQIIHQTANRFGLLERVGPSQFHVHITLARAQKGQVSELRMHNEVQKIQIESPMNVDRVELVLSDLTQGGPIYRVKETFALHDDFSGNP